MTSVVHDDYPGEGLSESELAPTPLRQVRDWLTQAEERQARLGDVPFPTTLAVATVDAAGMPNVRTVLLRFLDAAGPGFVTDLRSAKSTEIVATGGLAATMTWPTMFRAVRFRGRAIPLARVEVVEYFRSRPWGSRISAWASEQSSPVADRAALVAAYDRYAAQFPDTGSPDDVPTPDGWGGWRIDCDEVELWAGRRDRLHDRLVYVRSQPGDLDDPAAWDVVRRQP
jgi:pyridoxamine 5'-phosphate oxidase